MSICYITQRGNECVQLLFCLCSPRKKTIHTCQVPKTSSDHVYSSDDEAAEQPPTKKRKNANKASVPPAPKPPAIPKRNKKGNGKKIKKNNECYE